MRPARVLLAMCIALVLAACSGGADDGEAGPLDLSGSWELIRLDTGQNAPLVAGRPVTLEIVDDTTVGGSSACNSYFATVTVDGGSVSFSDVGSTLMACQSARMQLESAYLQALNAVDAGVRDRDRLTLTGPGVRLVFAQQG